MSSSRHGLEISKVQKTVLKFFKNPFVIKIETLPTELQLEVIELISNNNFKDYFKKSSLQEFHIILPEESFPNLKKHAREIM